MVLSQRVTRADGDLEVREQLSQALSLHENEPHVLLRTCGRTEVYWGAGEIPRPLALHLFRVAAGLESALLGEKAILGQVRKAYLEACGRYTLPPAVNRLFQSAMHAGKRVRSETKICCGAVSHSQAVVQMIKARKLNLNGKNVLIFGVNKLTADVMKFMREQGAVNFMLSNRSLDKAKIQAQAFGGSAFPLTAKRDLLLKADIVISATSAPHAILHAEDFKDLKHEILIFDLAFPRDVDPAVSDYPLVTLLDLDAVDGFAQHNIQLRQQEVVKADRIIDEELYKLENWQNYEHQHSRSAAS